jgi:uncharacterized protein YdbL (DUF1318 family)
MRRFRYWLADLISGGELTFQKNGWARSVAIHAETQAIVDDANRLANSDYRTVLRKLGERHEALALIAAEVKPTSNATVKRMGRIASEALK